MSLVENVDSEQLGRLVTALSRSLANYHGEDEEHYWEVFTDGIIFGDLMQRAYERGGLIDLLAFVVDTVRTADSGVCHLKSRKAFRTN